MGCGPKGRRFESCQAYPDAPPGNRRAVLLFRPPFCGRAARMGWYTSQVGEVSEWLKVPLSKSGVVMSHRGFESHPLRQNGVGQSVSRLAGEDEERSTADSR